MHSQQATESTPQPKATPTSQNPGKDRSARQVARITSLTSDKLRAVYAGVYAVVGKRQASGTLAAGLAPPAEETAYSNAKGKMY